VLFAEQKKNRTENAESTKGCEDAKGNPTIRPHLIVAETRMIAFLDAHYTVTRAVAACVIAEAWDSQTPVDSVTDEHPLTSAYVPGAFYLRELPVLLAVLRRVSQPLAIVVVDGYVELDANRPGLGRHLAAELGQAVTVVGVAKTEYRGAPAISVLRGKSLRPLYVSAVGMPAEVAAESVRSMAGRHRIPDLLRYVDRLTRQRAGGP
jgi:deoxyribonuclease V